jgi:hypothetical protein
MSLSSQPRSDDGLRTRVGLFVGVLWFFAGYFALSCLTIPFAGRLWSGEIPVLALIQIPKIAVAEWLRTHVVMELITFLGFSSGSFSPDYLLARPYALAIAYLLVIVVLSVLGWGFGFRLSDQRQRIATAAFLVMVATDYVFTFTFGGGPGFTIYG